MPIIQEISGRGPFFVRTETWSLLPRLDKEQITRKESQSGDLNKLTSGLFVSNIRFQDVVCKSLSQGFPRLVKPIFLSSDSRQVAEFLSVHPQEEVRFQSGGVVRVK